MKSDFFLDIATPIFIDRNVLLDVSGTHRFHEAGRRARNQLARHVPPRYCVAERPAEASATEPEKELWRMKKYRCTVCGYIYDPAAGDPDNGIDAGTSFEDLPDEWICPDCGVEKDMFEALD